MLDCQRKMAEEVHSSIVDAFVPLVAVDYRDMEDDFHRVAYSSEAHLLDCVAWVAVAEVDVL